MDRFWLRPEERCLAVKWLVLMLALAVFGCGADDGSDAWPDGSGVGGDGLVDGVDGAAVDAAISDGSGDAVHDLGGSVDTEDDVSPIGTADGFAGTDADAETLRTTIRFDPSSPDYFDMPFPSDLRRGVNGTLDFTGWPGLAAVSPFHLWFAAAEELLDGWGVNSGVFLFGSGPIDPMSLPQTREETIWDTNELPPAVFLIDVDEKSPELGRTWPLDVRYRELPGRYTPAWRISLIPPFGMPRRPATRYAVVVTSKVTDPRGEPLQRPTALDALLNNLVVTTASGRLVDGSPYLSAMDKLKQRGIEENDVVFLDVFTTGDISARLRKVAQWADGLATPPVLAPGLTWLESHDGYVVLSGRHWAPIVQQGELPFVDGGGEIVFGSGGIPEIQGEQWVRFNLSIPKGPMPAGGWPLAIYMHGSGGDWRQVLDRGPSPNPAPGSGPAAILAEFGVASMGFDFPLHGDRSDPPDTSGLLLYNLLGNPRATVDNFIMAAVEQVLRTRLASELTIDPALGNGSLDPGDASDGLIRFRRNGIVAMGQSMGSTIGVPWVTIDPNVKAVMLSGSGGILVEIATSAVEPFPLAPTLALIMGYGPDEELDRFDPALHALQHYWDLVDPVAHARHVIDEPHGSIPPKSVYQSSGLQDGYFSTDARMALTAALGLDIVEPLLEPQIADFLALTSVSVVAAPIGGNRQDGKITGVAAQFAPHAPGKGHYVSFELGAARSHYACFLRRAALYMGPVVSAMSVTAAECME